jgi:hypothetical protein
MQNKLKTRFYEVIQQQIAAGGERIEHLLSNQKLFKLIIKVLMSRVPAYELPDPLRGSNQELILTTFQWFENQHPWILESFRHEVYGKVPDAHLDISFEQLNYSLDALDGDAIRKEIRLTFQRASASSELDLLIYLPKHALKQPVPIFMGLNFMGNHSIHPDPEITLTKSWIPNNPEEGVIKHQATDAARGSRQDRWPVEVILQRGFGLVTGYCGDLDPDYDDGFQNGVHPLFYQGDQVRPAPDEWGSISAWAWGLQRAMDYCLKDDQIDHRRVALIGHSRLGKTALWAGAQDKRFAMVIANNSGCMGAALSRRKFGETVYAINHVFPHWFCENFKRYNDKESNLVVDQHLLIALIAPRPVYVASAQRDLWADPLGEFLALKAAEPVYSIFGRKGLPTEVMPEYNHPVWDTLGYHIRTGWHDITWYDWEQYLEFAAYHFKPQNGE